MRILIHAAGATMGGAQRHLMSFLPALSAAAGENECHVVVRKSFPALDYPSISLERIPDHVASAGLSRLWFENVSINRMIRRLGIDVVVSLANLGPIRPPVPHVIFQRNALLFSPEHMALFGPREVMRFRLQRLLATAAMKRARVIVTPSNAMAQLIQRNRPELPHDRFTVLPHAFDRSAYSEPLLPASAALLQRPGKKLLYPVLAGPHKGMEHLLRILKEIPRTEEITLYLTGGDEGGPLIDRLRGEAAMLGVLDRIQFLGRVGQRQMGALYQSCDLLVYSSPIESFGFALLEGLAFGLPIVAMDTPVNREICGPAALYFSKSDPRSAAQEIVHALDQEVGRDLKRNGQVQFELEDRSWFHYTQTLLGLLEKVCDEARVR